MHPIERVRALARASWLDPVSIAVEAADAIAGARSWMGDEVAVSVARRLIAWHPFAGPLWFAAGKVLHAVDPQDTAERVERILLHDPTPILADAALAPGSRVAVLGGGIVLERLAGAAYDASPARASDARRHYIDCRDNHVTRIMRDVDHVLLCVQALGPRAAAVPAYALDALAEASSYGKPVWIVAGEGTVVDHKLWNVMENLLDMDTPQLRQRTITDIWWDDPGDTTPPPVCIPIDEDTLVAGPKGIETATAARARAFAAPVDLLDAAGRPAF